MKQDEKKKPESSRVGRLLWNGFASGIVVTGLLNPWDRALYLSIINNRNFLKKENFSRPYQGLLQTLLARSISSGLYFPLEQMTRLKLNELPVSQNAKNIAGGCIVGAVTAVILNPLNFVKYHGWSTSDTSRFIGSSKNISRNAGPLGFYRGCYSALLRDMIFGATFSGLRNQNMPSSDEKVRRFLVNAASCFVATALSSPMNYSRNFQYASCTKDTCPSILTILRALKSKVYLEQKTFGRRLQSLQNHLRLGWGTARVAIGMSLTELMYSVLSEDRV